MKTLEVINRIEQMDQLIRLRATGTPREFAKRLKISLSRLFVYLETMKDMGAPLKYDKSARTYEYAFPVKFRIGFEPKT